MQEKLSLAAIYGSDYDQIKQELFGTIPHHWLENLSQLGLTHGMRELAIAMLVHRYSPLRRVPAIKDLARATGYNLRHVYGMLRVMRDAGFLKLEKVGRAYTISITGLVQRLRSLKKAKDAAKPALQLVSRPAPKPKPIPAPEPDPLPPAAEIDEEALDRARFERQRMAGMLTRIPKASPLWHDAKRRYEELDAWLKRYAPLLVAAAAGGG